MSLSKKRIKELADFFYSSNSSNDVPVRISLACGMCGFDISKQAFIEFINILNSSDNLKDDLNSFRDMYGN